MKEQNSNQFPTPDIQSVDVNCQILNQLQTILKVCDYGIHFKAPETPREMDSLLWNIRCLAESSLYKFNLTLE